MRQAKGKVPLFYPDRIISLYASSLTIETTLSLASEVKVPTPPLTFTAYLPLNFQALSARNLFVDILLFLDTLAEIKAWYGISTKGAGFAFKGTSSLFRADRRWIAFAPKIFSLLAEIPLSFSFELEFPTSLMIEAVLATQAAAKTIIEAFMGSNLFLLLNSFFSQTQYYAASLLFSKEARMQISEISKILLSLHSAYFSPFSTQFELLMRFVPHRTATEIESQSIKLALYPKLYSDFLSVGNLLMPLLTETILSAPSGAIYSLLLRCCTSSDSKINFFGTLNFLLSPLARSLISRHYESNLKFITSSELLTNLFLITFLKNELYFRSVSAFEESFSLFLRPIYFIPSLHSLVAQATLNLRLQSSYSYLLPINAGLLFNQVAEIKLLTPHIFSAKLKLLPSPSLLQDITYSCSLLAATSFASILFSNILSNLALSLSLRASSLKEIIGIVLMELKPRSEFQISHDFIANLLCCLTSSLPLPTIVLPYGGLFFTDIVRIYKYLIDLDS